MKFPTLSEIRKAAVALVGAVAQGISLGFLHGTALHYAQIVVAVATLLGVYVVPNGADSTPPQHDPEHAA